jgi:DNA-binding MarR family transcriptional regulator
VSIAAPSKRNATLPFDITRSVVHLLHRADQCSAEAFSLSLAHRDITPRQFAVLIAIAAREGATQTTITEDTGIDRSTMVDVVRRLMKRGLLQRRRSRTDARSYIVRLTDDGRRVVEAAQPEAADVDKAILAALSPAERGAFQEALTKVVAALTAMSASAWDRSSLDKKPGAPGPDVSEPTPPANQLRAR